MENNFEIKHENKLENKLINSPGAGLLAQARELVMSGKARVPLTMLIAVALVALLGFLYLKSQGVDYRRQNEILSYLRDLREIDARWDLEVLRARVEGASGKARPTDDRGARAPELLKRLHGIRRHLPSEFEWR